jgi:hypothetical protein
MAAGVLSPTRTGTLIPGHDWWRGRGQSFEVRAPLLRRGMRLHGVAVAAPTRESRRRWWRESLRGGEKVIGPLWGHFFSRKNTLLSMAQPSRGTMAQPSRGTMAHRRSLNLSSSYKKSSPIAKSDISHPSTSETVHFSSFGGSDPGLSDVAAESAWDPCGPHLSGCHVSPSLSPSPPFPSSSLSVSRFFPLAGRPVGREEVARPRRERRRPDG